MQCCFCTVLYCTGTGDDAAVYGSGLHGFADGALDVAQFGSVFGLCVSKNRKSGKEILLCADAKNHRIRCIDLWDGTVSTYAGSDVSAVTDGPRLTATFRSPRSICANPIRDGAYYIGDDCCVRDCDDETVSLVAGCTSGYVDGIGAAASFRSALSIICTSDDKTLFVSDTSNRRIRSIDCETKRVKAVCAMPASDVRCTPYQICFDDWVDPDAYPQACITGKGYDAKGAQYGADPAGGYGFSGRLQSQPLRFVCNEHGGFTKPINPMWLEITRKHGAAGSTHVDYGQPKPHQSYNADDAAAADDADPYKPFKLKTYVPEITNAEMSGERRKRAIQKLNAIPISEYQKLFIALRKQAYANIRAGYEYVRICDLSSLFVLT